MTTVACNRYMMASDSKVTLNSAVEDRVYSCSKLIRAKNGDIIGVAGDTEVIEIFLKWLGSKKKKPVFKNPIEFEAMILEQSTGRIKVYADTFAHDTIDHDCYAIGSGGNAARAAMLMGADPVRAVEVACLIDPHSAPPINILSRQET